MQFLVTGRVMDAGVALPQQELTMLKTTFEQFANETNPKIKAVCPFADKRATASLAEIDSADELNELIGPLPASRV